MSQSAPRWNMAVVYSSLESPEFEKAFGEVVADLTAVKVLFDRHGVMKRDDAVLDVPAFEEVVGALNSFQEKLRTVGTYIYCLIATDSRDDLAQAKQSELRNHMVELSKLGTRFNAWIGCLPVEELIAASAVAKDHAFAVRRAKFLAGKLMSPAEETLSAELGPTGGSAWARLHGNVTSILEADVSIAGKAQRLPMSVIRNLAYEPDRATRKSAYEAELAGWKTIEIPLAAAMNGIKGEVSLLSRKRGWLSPLDETLYAANIDRPTLDAMMGAAREAFPDFRRYMHAKAKALGIDRLAWYDLFAPLGAEERVWEYHEATGFVAKHFDGYSTKLGDMARRAFSESWVDAEPRLGKRDGAFCTSLRADESRVCMNYKPAFGAVSTLAHELGHAYHNVCLSIRTPLQRSTPMTLAETASIFCETIVREAALQEGSQAEKLAILEASLQGSCQVVVDITSRFLLESAVFEKRERRELSAAELCEAMLEAQRATYGDGLDGSALHPYMWAMKPHYYSAGRSFYNFPYMFGLLFGLGLYAVYEKDPDGFKKGYDDLLSSTGLDDAAGLASRFGIDIRTSAFWEGSLDTIRKDIDAFEELVAR